MEPEVQTGSARIIRRARGLVGVYDPPGDKSISHRALLLGARARGETVIANLAEGRDVRRTISCLRVLGVDVNLGPARGEARVVGRGTEDGRVDFHSPDRMLDCGNSGTTARLLAGVLAGQGFEATLTGDASLSRRPMARVAVPLRRMGAEISLTPEDTLPMTVKGGGLIGTRYESPIASAQVKSAVLLAGLSASGLSEYVEPVRTRDHTERMLKAFGASIETRAGGGGRGEYSVRLNPGSILMGRELEMPGDFSSALYLVVGGLLLSRSDLTLRNVGLNPGRSEALRVLTRMGAKIEVVNRRMVAGESRGDLKVHPSKLKGAGISGSSVVWLMDEIPALAVAMAFAEGESFVKGAEELRHKESDRIIAVVHNLRALGLEVGEFPDGFILRGRPTHDGGEFRSFDDHRIAMAFHVAALACQGESVIHGYDEAVDVSWPDFPEVVEALARS
jgi:3-phosphoshikimate 1-carboxyvinyltransferase